MPPAGRPDNQAYRPRRIGDRHRAGDQADAAAAAVTACNTCLRESFAEKFIVTPDRTALRLSDYSTLMLANLMTLPHLATSAAVNWPNAAAEPGSAVPPRLAIFAFIAASARPNWISWLSRSMRLGGTFFGATRPIHWLASKPGTTVLTVGTSGSKAERAVVVTASGRRPPDPDLLDGQQNRADHALDLTAERIGDGLRAAAIGDKDDVGAAHHVEQFAGDMLAASRRVGVPMLSLPGLALA